MNKTTDAQTLDLAQRAIGEISAHLPSDLDFATAVDALAALLRTLDVTAEPDPTL